MEHTKSGDRAHREKAAYDEGGTFKKKNRRLHNIFGHVRRAPNSLKGFDDFERRVSEDSKGGCVLEIGCGRGYLCEKVFRDGAKSVLGIDISREMLKKAADRATDDLAFRELDVHQPLPGTYDVIFGQAILHHLDYREILPRLYQNNLNPGGKMYFMEPLGQSWILRLYWKFGTEFHTPDERPFMRSDLKWLDSNFPSLEIVPINYTTVPLGLASSFIFRQPDNILTRVADRIDRFIVRRMKFLHSRFRSAVFVIEKRS